MAEQLASLLQCDYYDTDNLITGTIGATSVPNNTWTTIASVAIKANHTYLICGSNQFTQSVNGVIVVADFYSTEGEYALQRITDGMNGGGGVCMSALVRPSTDVTVNYRVYQNSGSTRTPYKVVFNAYQLD